MASTYSNLGLEIQQTGSNANTWGERTNKNLNYLDNAIAGYTTVQCNSTTISLAFSTNNSSTTFTDENGRNKVIQFTSGSASAAITVTLPEVEKEYLVENASGQSITFESGSGSTVTVSFDNTYFGHIYTDGTNVYNALNKLQIDTLNANSVIGGADPIVYAIALG